MQGCSLTSRPSATRHLYFTAFAVVNKMFTQDSNKLKLEQQLTALRQELEATKSERDEALSSLAALQKGSKAAISTVVVMQNSAKDEQVVKSPQSTLQDSDDKQTSSREGDIKSVISQGNLKDNQTSLKWQRRRLIKQILGRKVTKSMVQEAIKLYDLEKDYTSQSPEALSGLERLFGIDDIEWPSEYDRMIMISEKVSHSLKNTLRMYGCVFFLHIEIKTLVTFLYTDTTSSHFMLKIIKAA
jgi:hypothetical protein